MTITTKFGLRQEVCIKYVKAIGTIIAIIYSGEGVEYRVVYWMDGERRSDVFMERELE